MSFLSAFILIMDPIFYALTNEGFIAWTFVDLLCSLILPSMESLGCIVVELEAVCMTFC